jgi:hypothetical protein
MTQTNREATQAVVDAARKDAAAANHPFASLCGCDIHIALRTLDATLETESERIFRKLSLAFNRWADGERHSHADECLSAGFLTRVTGGRFTGSHPLNDVEATLDAYLASKPEMLDIAKRGIQDALNCLGDTRSVGNRLSALLIELEAER